MCAWARQVMREADVLESGLRALSRPRRGDLAIAASLTVAEQLMHHWLGEMRHAHPGQHISLSVVNSAEVHRAVTDGRVACWCWSRPGMSGPAASGPSRARCCGVSCSCCGSGGVAPG